MVPTRREMALYAFFLLLSTAVGKTGEFTFRVPVRFQPHYVTTGHYDEEPSGSRMRLPPPPEQQEQQHGWFKHENSTILTAKNKLWRGEKKNNKSSEKGTSNVPGGIEIPLPEEAVTGGGRIEIPLPEEAGTGYASAVPLDVGNVILGRISLGSQSFEVTFDTGSTSLWVFGKRVGKARKIEVGYASHKRAEFDHRFYDEDLSSETFKLSPKRDEFEYKYGDGTVVEGRLGTETLKIGGSNDLVLKDLQQFGIADTLGGTVPQSILYDGILGLGYNPTRVSTFARMTEQGLGKMYSVYMSKDGKTGEIMMGGSNSELYKEPVHFAKVVASANRGHCYAGSTHWCVQLEEIGFSSGRSSRGRKDSTPVYSFGPKDPTQYPYGLVDTGASFVYLPYSLAKTISAGNEILQEAFFNSKRTTVPCNRVHTLPTLRIKIGGEYLELTGPEYSYSTVRRGGGVTCRLEIVPRRKDDAKSEFISIGLPFLRKYYTIFMGQGSGSTGKPHQIGFALANHTP